MNNIETQQIVLDSPLAEQSEIYFYGDLCLLEDTLGARQPAIAPISTITSLLRTLPPNANADRIWRVLNQRCASSLIELELQILTDNLCLAIERDEEDSSIGLLCAIVAKGSSVECYETESTTLLSVDGNLVFEWDSRYENDAALAVKTALSSLEGSSWNALSLAKQKY